MVCAGLIVVLFGQELGFSLAANQAPSGDDPWEVVAWANDALEPVRRDLMYEEHAGPRLNSIRKKLKSISALVSEDDDPLPMYLARLKFDVARLQRRHQEAIRLGRTALESNGCLEEDDQESQSQNCFPDVLSSLLLEAYRAGDAAVAADIFQTFAHKHPHTAKYPSHLQFPPTYFERNKRSKPFWLESEVPFVRVLQDNAATILEELKHNVLDENGGFRDVKVSEYQRRRDMDGFQKNALSLCSPMLRSDSPKCWQEYNIYVAEHTRGVWSSERCQLTPKTCGILQVPEVIGRLNKHADAANAHDGIAGKAGFIRLMPNASLLAHTGPHNGRLTIHLGLKIPSNSFIEVGGERRTWTEGKAIILDDSFAHHVVNDDKTEDRIIFLVHVWHPDLVEELGYDDPVAARWSETKKSVRQDAATEL